LKAKYRVDDNIIYHWTNHDLQLRPLFQSQHSFLQAGTGLSRLNTSQGPRFTHAHFKSMTVRQLYQLAQVGNEELERQCASGRARALDGDREGSGIAQAFEVERRRRTRASQMRSLPPEATPVRAWWKFWQAGDDHRPMTST
jgi:hypothetical protein